MSLPFPSAPRAALAASLIAALLLAACGPSQPPLMKRVEDAEATRPRVPIVTAQPRPTPGAEAAANAPRSLGKPAAAAKEAAPVDAAAIAPDASVIYFGHDRYQVDDAYAPLLQAHAKRLLADPAQLLRIDAFTDDSGPADYNLELSRMRATMVQRELRALGVPARQMQVVGHGPGERHARHAANSSGTRAPTPASARRVELSYR
jgi:peptidoglycan-associated lipoprotein